MAPSPFVCLLDLYVKRSPRHNKHHRKKMLPTFPVRNDAYRRTHRYRKLIRLYKIVKNLTKTYVSFLVHRTRFRQGYSRWMWRSEGLNSPLTNGYISIDALRARLLIFHNFLSLYLRLHPCLFYFRIHRIQTFFLTKKVYLLQPHNGCKF